MNFNNFTRDQKESFWIILVLLTIASLTFVGGGMLLLSYPIISLFLFICGLFLTVLAGTGVYLEFVEKPREAKKYSDWYQD